MDKISKRLTIEEHNGQRISCADYRGLKESEMIELTKRHLELSLREKLSYLSDFNNTYATTDYMKQGRIFVEQTKNIVKKGALLGVNPVKSFILKAIVFTFGVNYRAFNSKEEAIEFLTTDN